MEKELPSSVAPVTDNTPEVPAVVPEADGTNDPLDSITDVEEIRREAKKYRGIASRKERKDVPDVKSDTPYVTRDEFYATNRKQAIESIEMITDTDPLADTKREISDNWDDIVKYYVSRNGQETAASILEDIYDAHLVWKRRQVPGDDSARSLQTMTVANPTGGRSETKANANNIDKRFSKGTPPAQWYGKKD